MLLNILLYTPLALTTSNPLQDAGWVGVIVAVLVGIASVTVAIWAVRKQRNQKVIMYQVMSDAPIVSINKQLKDRVKIVLDGKQVEDINLLVLKVWNAGNVAVKRDDFDEPIMFEFDGRKIVDAEVLDDNPKDIIKDKKEFLSQPSANVVRASRNRNSTPQASLEPKDSMAQNSIQLPKFLLNPTESFNIKLLLTGSKGDVKGKARIIDGKITPFDPNNQPVTLFARIIVVPMLTALAVLSIIGIVLNMFGNQFGISDSDYWNHLVIVVIGLSLAAFGGYISTFPIKRIRKYGLMIRW